MLSKAPSRPTSIVDWSGDGRAVGELVNEVEAVDTMSRLAVWGNGLPQDLKPHLLDAGFHPDPNEKRGLILRSTSTEDEPWSTDAESLLNIDGWNLRMIFSDRH